MGRKPSDHIQDEDLLNPSKLHILAGLSRPGMIVYQGTVDKETIRRRRAKNKRARIARRKNRK